MLCGAVVGLVSYLLVHSLQFQHSVMDKGQPPSNSAPALVALWRVQSIFLLAVKLPWVAVVFLFFAWLTVRQRNKEDGWAAAFAAAFFFVSILRQLIQKP